MSFEDEANILKNKFNNLVKLYKKHEKIKKDKNISDPDFFTKDNELNNSISLFFQEYGKFIKPRKNGLGIFNSEDFISYKMISQIKSARDGVFSRQEVERKAFTVGEIFENKDDEPEYFNETKPILNDQKPIYNETKPLFKEDIPYIGGIYSSRSPGHSMRINNLKDKSPGIYNGRFIGTNQPPKMNYSMNMPYNQSYSYKHIIQPRPSINYESNKTVPSMSGKSPTYSRGGNKSPTYMRANKTSPSYNKPSVSPTFNRPNVSPTFNRPNVYSRPDVAPSSFNKQNVSPTFNRPNVSPTFSRPIVSPTFNRPNVSPTFDRPNIYSRQNIPSSYMRENNLNSFDRPPAFDRSPAFDGYNRTNESNIYNRPNIPSSYMRSNVSPSFNRPNVSPSFNRPNVSPSFNRPNIPPAYMRPNISPENTYKPNSYSSNLSFTSMKNIQTLSNPSKFRNVQSPILISNTKRTGQYSRQTQIPYSIRPGIGSSEYHMLDTNSNTSTFYDKYVQNQISINDIIKSKKAKNTESKPVILNSCTVSNKKVDTYVTKKTTLQDLTNKKIENEAEELLYEICDNFMEHIIVASGEYARENKRLNKEDIKFIMRMEFGLEK
ncbi:putative transcription initiation factor TFIID subunit TAF12 [Vairimorpha necatrix]|uniref:Transcription initiation factor TFIID subunit TAF12 n=1 Tax=Vairimorpha necatrix TaxID=6039 RepID=A0AAX4JE65_9MICR